MCASGPVRSRRGPLGRQVDKVLAGLGSGDVGSRGKAQQRRAIAGQMGDLLPDGDGHGEAGKTVIRDAAFRQCA